MITTKNLPKRTILLIGSGSWADRIEQILLSKFQISSFRLKARDYLENHLDSTFDIAICATRPELQEMLIEKLANDVKIAWLEKPLASSYLNAQQLINTSNKNPNFYFLINNSWTFSNIWKEFKNCNKKLSSVSKIKMNQFASSNYQSHANPLINYGSHDIALLFDWFATENEYDIENRWDLEVNDADQTSFKSNFVNINIEWAISFAAESTRGMKWEIFWQDGTNSLIDFYQCRMLNDNNLKLVTNRSDNIDNFWEALNSKNLDTALNNHTISLQTIKFFEFLR